MANDSQLRASEIKGILLSEIEHYEEELTAEEVGEVLEVKDGIARIYGLTKAMASEMLEISSGDSGETVTALALNLEEDNIGAVILGDWTHLREGDQVRRTARVLEVPVGAGYQGRVVDPLDPSADAAGRGARVVMRDNAGNALADLIVGQEVDGKLDVYYVREPGKRRTYSTKLEGELSTKFADWIETDASTARETDVKLASKPSPVCLISRPPASVSAATATSAISSMSMIGSAILPPGIGRTPARIGSRR